MFRKTFVLLLLLVPADFMSLEALDEDYTVPASEEPLFCPGEQAPQEHVPQEEQTPQDILIFTCSAF